MFLFVTLFLIFSPTAFSLLIINPETCSVPYLIPRAFQRSCDLSDAYYEPTVRVATDSGAELSFIVPPEFAASSFYRQWPNLWTHEPFCLESLEAKNGFCVFTNAHFANGRGISIISTPEQILDVGDTPIFKHGEHMKSQNVAPGAKKYTRSAVPGEKQFVVTANAAFKRGENIHTFTPILALQHDANDHLHDMDLTLLLRVGVNRLPIASQQLFLDQYKGDEGDPFIDRIDKNSFTSYIGKTEHYFLQALPENARFNHACRPNTEYQFDPKTFTHLVNANQPIKPGEEITVSYISPYLNSTARREKLQHQWGFTCTCSLCSSTPKRITLSDTRIARITKLASYLYLPVKERKPDTEKAERIVKLHELEGLWGPIANAQAFAALEYWEAGNKTRASEYARMARESYLVWSGEGHEYFGKMGELLERLGEDEGQKKKGWF